MYSNDHQNNKNSLGEKRVPYVCPRCAASLRCLYRVDKGIKKYCFWAVARERKGQGRRGGGQMEQRRADENRNGPRGGSPVARTGDPLTRVYNTPGKALV